MMMQAWTHARMEVQTRTQVHAEAQGPPALVHPPSLAQKTPLGPEEIMRRIAEAGQLEEVGRLPQLSPTQQLAQMAADAGPVMSGGGTS